MIPVAFKNLLHNRARLAVALGGVSFSVVLTLIELGILLGFLKNATAVIDRTPAELWVMAPQTPNQDMSHPISDRIAGQTRSVPGVAWAENLIFDWGVWKGADGRQENVQIIGIDLDGHIPLPLIAEKEDLEKLRRPNTVLLDTAERKRLGVDRVGVQAELWGRRAEVVGFTRGGRTFTTAAILVAQYDQAKEFTFTPMGGQTSFVQVKVADGHKIEDVQERLRERLAGVEVLTGAEFRARTIRYWLVTTGVGTGFLISALMGLLVGGAVVAQVLYANVVENLKEFGVMKALGASPWWQTGLLLEQAAYVGLGGCALGLLSSAGLARLVEATQTPIWMPWPLMLCALGVAVLICLAASMVPAAKLLRLEPAAVFMS